MQKLTYYCDHYRHLICVPYTIENLHRMAKELNIKRCWFHKNHYDIPKLRIKEITDKCEMISSKEIISIITDKGKMISSKKLILIKVITIYNTP